MKEGEVPHESSPDTKFSRHSLDRAGVIEALGNGKHLEGVAIPDVNLAGLELRGKSFRGSDVRGVKLFDEENPETRTDIRETDWTDAEIGDFGNETLFVGVDATGAKFGFSEPLLVRRARHLGAGGDPKVEDSGALCNFNGQNGDFIDTTWKNVNFAGGSGYEARFEGADLSGSTFEGADLRAIDFSQSKLENVAIKNPVSLVGMRVRFADAESLAKGITFSYPFVNVLHATRDSTKPAAEMLAEVFGVIVVKPPDRSEAARERDEKMVSGIIERLRAEKWFREGESAKIVFPGEKEKKAWKLRIDTVALLDAPADPNRAVDDLLHAALVAAGYRVEVLSDIESMTDTTMGVEYLVFEQVE